MTPISRRTLFGLAAVSAIPSFARTLDAVGVQLYTLRSVLPADPLGTLRALEQLGYREAELTADNLDGVFTALKQTSLKPVSLHMDTALFLTRQEELPAALEDAKNRGIEYVVCPYIPPANRGGAEVMQRLGDTLNKAGEMCRKLGLRLCYHNHAFEFEPSGDGTLLDVLLRASDAKLLGLELDIMWARAAGVEPVSVLKQYANRVPLIHLKNLEPGLETRYTEQGMPASGFREVGNGVIDIAKVLAAAAEAGVEHYFVEQDQTPGDPLDSLRQSYDYLAKLDF